MFIRFPSGDIEKAVQYRLRSEVQALDINLGVVSVWMVFKAMGVHRRVDRQTDR